MSSSNYTLPYRDELGFCNIFLSAIGGDGANMAAKLLFKIGVTAFGLDGGYDAKYGSEKTGTPTDVSVRFCELGTPVRQAGPTTHPHYLVAFHQDLIRPLGLKKGLQPNATCIVNSHQPPEVIRDELMLHSGTVVCVDATKVAAETNSRLNMPMLAMLCHELKFDDEPVKEAIAKQWPRAAKANLAAYDATIETARRQTFEADGKYELEPYTPERGPIGYLNMLRGGAIDALTHNTEGRDNRLSGRGFVPEFDPEACNSCGICLTVCSDPGALLWRDGRMVGIEPTFCKGCMRCVEVCRVNALKRPAAAVAK